MKFRYLAFVLVFLLVSCAFAEEGAPTAENNGGFFLCHGDQVYFREYDPSALDDVCLPGNFLRAVRPGNPSRICCYDTATGEKQVLFEDCSSGTFYLLNGRFYLTESYPDYTTGLYSTDLTGGDRRELLRGSALRVHSVHSETGALAVSFYQNGEQQVVVLNESGILSSFVPDGDLGDGLTSGDHFFCLLSSDAQGEPRFQVCALSLVTGEMTCLGTLPSTDDGFPVLRQAQSDGQTVTLGFEYLGGTGHFFYHETVIRARLDGLSEPEVLGDWGVSDQLEEYNDFSFAVDGTLFLLEPHPANFYTYWPNDFIRHDYEVYEVLPCGTFVAEVTSRHHPDGDIGWREAYKRLNVQYYYVNSEADWIPMFEMSPELVEITAWVRLLVDEEGDPGYYASLLVYEPLLIPADDPDARAAHALTDADFASTDFVLLPNGYRGYLIPLSESATAQLLVSASDGSLSLCEADTQALLDVLCGHRENTCPPQPLTPVNGEYDFSVDDGCPENAMPARLTISRGFEVTHVEELISLTPQK